MQNRLKTEINFISSSQPRFEDFWKKSWSIFNLQTAALKNFNQIENFSNYVSSVPRSLQTVDVAWSLKVWEGGGCIQLLEKHICGNFKIKLKLRIRLAGERILAAIPVYKLRPKFINSIGWIED